MSDNTPTLRLPAASPPQGSPALPEAPPPRPSRAPQIAFAVLSVVVVAAIGVLVYVLVDRTNSNPPSSTAPAATATIAPPLSPTQPPAAAVAPGTFTVFTVPPSQECRGHGKGRQAADVQVTWETSNATQVWVAPGMADAATVGSQQVPLSGNQDSFSSPLALDCNGRSNTFTMTLIGADGAHASRTWTVLVSDHHG